MAKGKWKVENKPPKVVEEPWCMVCDREWVREHGDWCEGCLDRRMESLNRAIRVNAPLARVYEDGEVSSDEVERRVWPLLTERAALLRRMTPARRKWWREKNKWMELPACLRIRSAASA